MTTLAVSLSERQRAAIAGGGFVRVELGDAGVAVPVVPGLVVPVRSALVGRARSGELRAYLNVCRHQAVPLDVVLDVDDEAARGEAVPAPVTDEGETLLCLRHGAEYTLDEGACVSGPCLGERLFRLEADDGPTGIRVKLRLFSG